MTRNKITLINLVSLCLVTLIQLSHAEILFRAGFENRNINEVDSKHADKPGTEKVIQIPFSNSDDPSESVLKFQATENSERAEIHVKGVSEFNEFWCGWQNYIPENWKPANRGPQGGRSNIIAHNATVDGYIPDMNSHPYDFACVNGGWGDVADAVAILRLADKGLINLLAWGIKTAKENDKTRYRESNEFLELARQDGLKNVPSKTLSGVSKSHVLYSNGTTSSNPLSLPAANSEMGKRFADLARAASPGDELIIMSGDCMIPIADMVLILNNSDVLKNVWVLQSATEKIMHINNGAVDGRKEPKAYQVVVSSKLNVVFGDDICRTPRGDKKNDKCDFPGPSDGGMHVYVNTGEKTSMNWWRTKFDKSLGNLRNHMIDLVARGQSRIEYGSYDPSYMLGFVHGYLPEANRKRGSANNNGREVGSDPKGNIWYGKLDNTSKQGGKTVIEHWKDIVNGKYTLADHGGGIY